MDGDGEIASFSLWIFGWKVDVGSLIVYLCNGYDFKFFVEFLVSKEKDAVFEVIIANSSFLWIWYFIPIWIFIWPFCWTFTFTPRISQFDQSMYLAFELQFVGLHKGIGVALHNSTYTFELIGTCLRWGYHRII